MFRTKLFYTDTFIPENTPAQNDTRGVIIGTNHGKRRLAFKLICDEYFKEFKGFTDF
jgi:hypothetical protein